jgi:hypothetical protein
MLKEFAKSCWHQQPLLQDYIDGLSFQSKAAVTVQWNPPEAGPRTDDAIERQANLWTEKRDAYLTEVTQAMGQAENYWKKCMQRPILRYVNPEIIKKKAAEIRKLCMDEAAIGNIAQRCWDYADSTKNRSTIKSTIEKHLEHHERVTQEVAFTSLCAEVIGVKMTHGSHTRSEVESGTSLFHYRSVWV